MQKPLFTLGAALLLLATSPALASGEWEELHGCRLLPQESNDGDSFHAEHTGKEYIFRLYFVDCPETNDEYPERLADQAEHFNTTPERVKTIGLKAKAATAELLSDGFMAVTRWQEAGGRSNLARYYAFIFIDGQDSNVPADLNAVLVASGLARVHGVKAKPPGVGLSAADLQDTYADIEQEAKREGVGAWGSGDEIDLAAATSRKLRQEDSGSSKSASLILSSETLMAMAQLPSRVTTLAPQEGRLPMRDSPPSRDDPKQGRPVSFGQRSQVLYERFKDESIKLRLDASEDSVAKVVDYPTGRVVAVAWIAAVSPESGLWIGVPRGLYKIVYAQQVHETADGEFYAGYYGKLRDPVEVRFDPLTSVDLSIKDTEYPNVKSSAKEFGSFRPPR